MDFCSLICKAKPITFCNEYTPYVGFVTEDKTSSPFKTTLDDCLRHTLLLLIYISISKGSLIQKPQTQSNQEMLWPKNVHKYLQGLD